MGSHVLLNLYDCEEIGRLEDLESFTMYIGALLSSSKAEVVGTSAHQFTPGGYTYLALLTTSHFSIHTWPEMSSAAVDVFTCGDVDTRRIVNCLQEYFRSSTVSVRNVLR
jgi:S-adenosylmethionine decarboxylase